MNNKFKMYPGKNNGVSEGCMRSDAMKKMQSMPAMCGKKPSMYGKKPEMYGKKPMMMGGPGKRFLGENTEKVKTGASGKYTTISESSKNFNQGDTIMLGNKAPIIDGYLMGGDYKASKVGKKKYKMK